MNCKYLRQGKGQDVQSFTEEFRKQALNLGIALDTLEFVTKYIGSLHSYMWHSLLLFEPTTIDASSAKAIYIKNKGKNEREDQSRKPSSKPPNGKSKEKWKGKEKKTTTSKEGEWPYCNHFKKEGHDDDHCWKQNPKKFPKKYGEKGKQKTVAKTQQDLGSDSGDEALVDESILNDKKRIELFHIRVVVNHTKVETLSDMGSQANLIVESLVKKLGLETKLHPKPYPLGWIYDKAKLNVTQQCKVKFLIASKLVDEVEIDVIPLEICGMVLGSPYPYDRKSIFFHHENKYHITKDGIEYIVQAHQNKINTNLVSTRQMKQLVNSSKACTLMVIREKEAEFTDAFQGATGIPPQREIQHEIHLLHDAPLWNIDMYRMSAIKMEEIKHQVQDLMDQGVIRLSSSPCGSPIV
eukprot:PITA_19006